MGEQHVEFFLKKNIALLLHYRAKCITQQYPLAEYINRL